MFEGNRFNQGFNMNYQESVLSKVKSLLEHHTYISIEFQGDSFLTVMENRNPNMLGNFAGGDMSYIANAAAGLQCVVEGVISQTASINIECIARGEGDLLISSARIIHKGSKLIRIRSEVFVRKNNQDKLVAIAQINMAPLSDQASANKIISQAK